MNNKSFDLKVQAPVQHRHLHSPPFPLFPPSSSCGRGGLQRLGDVQHDLGVALQHQHLGRGGALAVGVFLNDAMWWWLVRGVVVVNVVVVVVVMVGVCNDCV